MMRPKFAWVAPLFCMITPFISQTTLASDFFRASRTLAQSVSDSTVVENSSDEPTPPEPARDADPSHPKVIAIHFSPSTSNSKILVFGTVSAGTDSLQFVWKSPELTTGRLTDLVTAPIVNLHFEIELTLQYGPGVYSLSSSVGRITPRGVAVYADAVQVVGEVSNTDPIPHYTLSSTNMIQSDDPEIQNLAAQITANVPNVYAKVHAIHDWVSKNISYDNAQITHVAGTKDYYSTVQTKNDNSSVIVLHERKGICFGYSNLTSALLRSIGIPARTVTGPVLLTSNDHWIETLADKDKPNFHAWNEAFVDGRWIVLDTTWDNVFAQKFFDPTPALFGKDHRKVPVDEPRAMSLK